MGNELQEKLEDIFCDDVEKIVLSNGKNGEYKKIVIQKRNKGYQAEKFTDKQAFHENLTAEAVR